MERKGADMQRISNVEIITTSMISRKNEQKAVLVFEAESDTACFLCVYKNQDVIVSNVLLRVQAGKNEIEVFLSTSSGLTSVF